MIGRTVSHYKIVEKLGEGGMGVVYKAEDTKLDRAVALKFLPPHLLASYTEKQRFLNEARTAARLSHRSICTVYEIDSAGEHTFIAMEYIPGRDLGRRLASGPLELEQAAGIALDLCGALREAHAAEIIHRDIKPSNIMISENGRTVLLDFGVARLKTDPKLTRTGTTVGTSAYLSPEQVFGEGVDHRSDIWSLGVVLYQMLAGRLPFQAEHEAALLYAIAHENPERLSSIRPDIPVRLERIVERAMAKKPADRYPNVEALRTDLQAFLQTGGDDKPPPKPPTAGSETRRRRLVRGGWAGLIIVIAALSVWYWSRGRHNAPPQVPSVSSPAARQGPAPGERADHRQSIAVLPLANMSAESGSEFFADGMTEEIITQLARLKALKVISRTSVMQYKKTTKRLPQIAGELGVTNILEGSVLRAGDRVRISVQLIDGTKDEHLWADSYEGDLGDVLSLQRRVARDVADQIKIELTPEETERLAAAPVVNKRAYDLYLQGRFHWNKRTPDGVRRALEFYRQALAVDPDYALAYAGVAESYMVAASWGYTSTGETCPKGRQAAEKALSLDPDLAEAQAVLGLIAEICDWDWSASEQHLRRAIELNPGDVFAHLWYAHLLGATRRSGEAAAQARLAGELDPLSPLINGAVAEVLAQNGEFDAAIALIDRVRGFEPDCAPLYFYESGVYLLKHDDEKAARAMLRYNELIAETDRDREEFAEARRALDEKGLDAFYALAIDYMKRRDREERGMLAYYLAVYYALMNEPDSAMAWLEHSFQRREGTLCMIASANYGYLASLRSDPRLHDLLRRMGLPAPSTPANP